MKGTEPVPTRGLVKVLQKRRLEIIMYGEHNISRLEVYGRCVVLRSAHPIVISFVPVEYKAMEFFFLTLGSVESQGHQQSH